MTPSVQLLSRAEADVDRADQVRGVRLASVVAAGLGAASSFTSDLGPLCPLQRFAGVPCPLCGLTSGVWATVHGDVVGAFWSNPVSPAVLVVLALAWTPAGPQLVDGASRRPWAIATLLLLLWGWQMRYFSVA